MIELRSRAWSPARPVAPGWYWVRMPGVPPTVVLLKKSNRGLVAFWPGRFYDEPIRDRGYDAAEWSGPLTPPAP